MLKEVVDDRMIELTSGSRLGGGGAASGRLLNADCIEEKYIDRWSAL